jgi:hypothetical protein
MTEVRILKDCGFEKLFTTNYLAASKQMAEDMGIANAKNWNPAAIVIAHAKRSSYVGKQNSSPQSRQRVVKKG